MRVRTEIVTRILEIILCAQVAFSLPFVPGNAPPRATDAAALVLISLGLALYRFGAPDALKRRLPKRCRSAYWRTAGTERDDREAALIPNNSAEFF